MRRIWLWPPRRGSRRGLKWGVTKAEKERYHELLKTLELGLEDRMTAKVGLSPAASVRR